MKMNIILLSCFIILMVACNNEIYNYKGIKYKVFSKSGYKDPALIHAVDMSHQDLIEFPEGIYELKNLILLNMSFTHIRQIDSRLCGLDELKVLSLNGNEAILLPECLYSMNLESLLLFGCDIQLEIKKLSKMKKLEYLGIGGNRFSEDDLQFLEKELPNTRIITSRD